MTRRGLSRLRRQAIALLVLACLPLTVSAAGAVDEAAVDSLVARALEAFDTPGMAVAVVHGDDLLYAKGHGVRRVGGSEPVTADTLFQIASLTKAITAGALAILVDEEKLAWDDKVIDHIPEFRLHDAYATREFTVKDLLSHRSGLPLGAGDLLFWPDGRSSMADLYRALAHLEPVTGFRTTYAYDNLFYIVAGDIVARRSGMPWAEFVEKRIFEPVGMADCKASHTRVPAGANEAAPHVIEGGKVVPAPYFDLDAHGPDAAGSPPLIASLGGVNCNASGLAKWLSLQLAGGKLPNGEQLFSAERRDEMWTPLTIVNAPRDEKTGRILIATYAMGWAVRPIFGRHQVVTHTGGLTGMTSIIMLFPEHDLGVLALSNSQNGGAMRATAQQIAADYLGVEIPDQVQELSKAADETTDKALAEMQAAWENRAKRQPAVAAARGVCAGLSRCLVRPDHDLARGRRVAHRDGSLAVLERRAEALPARYVRR